jgi:hypothetical protein
VKESLKTMLTKLRSSDIISIETTFGAEMQFAPKVRE